MVRLAESRPPLLVFAEDWGRHVSACQHLVRRLCGRYRVIWVNTIGTRRPRLDWATARRAWQKARDWLRHGPAAGGPPADRPLVLNPVMWPWLRSPLDRRLNRALLVRQLLPVLEGLPEPPVAVTKVPVTADLIGALPVRQWVYYCVDDFTQWPGLDQPALRAMEDVLVNRADRLIAVSEPLREKLARMGRRAELLTHGVDRAHWSAAGPAGPAPELDGLERPLVMSWGLVDRRIDAGIVRRLAADLGRGTVVFVGPQADPPPQLGATPRVALLPASPYGRLPCLARHADVLIMPYADLPVTRAMQPLKLMEFLSTAKPAVVRRLPSTRRWADCLDEADGPADFAAAVRRRLAEGLPADQRAARTALADEDWDSKALAFERLVVG